jgi:hypothetical protein
LKRGASFQLAVFFRKVENSKGSMDNADKSWGNEQAREKGSPTMITREYRANRARFPWAELSKYRGGWVAFSADGCRIVAHGESLEQVEEQVVAAGEDPQRVVREWIAGPEDDSLLGGGELL